MTAFDQADIAAEAAALEAFVEGATAAYGVDAARLVFVGNSNGANMLAAAMRLHPGLVRKAILLRPVDVLDPTPSVDLGGVDILVLVGRHDPFRGRSEDLAARLSADGAAVTLDIVEAGHELIVADREHARGWLAARV